MALSTRKPKFQPRNTPNTRNWNDENESPATQVFLSCPVFRGSFFGIRDEWVEEFEPLMNADERGWKCSVSMSWMSHCIAMAA
jgi:hypothetical protein